MFIKKFFPLALLLCLGLSACEPEHIEPPIDPNSPAAKAEKAAAEKAKAEVEGQKADAGQKKEEAAPDKAGEKKAENPEAEQNAQNQEKQAEEPSANAPREDPEVKAPEKKTKQPVKLNEKQTKEFAKFNNSKQKVTDEVDSGDEWQYITMSQDAYKKFLDKNLYWYAGKDYSSKDWKITSTPLAASADLNWNDKNNVILLRRTFTTKASFKYSNPKTTMHARYTGKMDVYINNILVYSDKDKLPNTGEKYTELHFDKAPVVITDLNTISAVILSKEANNNFDMAIELTDDPNPPAAPAKADAKAPAAPAKADAKAPAAPPKADAKAPAAPPKADAKAPAAPPKADAKK